jgi:hypothetical protein
MADKIIQTNNNLLSIKCNLRFGSQRHIKPIRIAANGMGMDRVILFNIYEIRWSILLHFDNKPSSCIISGNSGETG